MPTKSPETPNEILLFINDMSLRLMEAIELEQRSEVKRMLATRGELIGCLESLLTLEARPPEDTATLSVELDRLIKMGQWIHGHLLQRLETLKEQRCQNAATLHQARAYRPAAQAHLSTRQLKA